MGDLVLDVRGNLGLKPEVIGYLASIKEDDCNYIYYNIRHPMGTFNIALGFVINDLIELLIELEEIQEKYGNYDNYKKMELNIKLKNLLIDLFKFRDSLYHVLLGCCKKHNPPSKNEPIHEWLKKNKYLAGKELHSEINNYLKYFNIINNKLKHTSSTIENIYFHTKDSAIMGFYVTGIDNNGSIGPDEMIHPKINGEYSASSYNFLLKEIYYVIYKISFSFRNVLIKHFVDVYNMDLKFNSNCNKEDKKERELFYRMRKLPDTYFPNEFGKLTHEFKLENNKFYLLEKPAETIDLKGYQIICMFAPDGISRKFTLPYKR